MIKSNAGKGRKNNPVDIIILQLLLNKLHITEEKNDKGNITNHIKSHLKNKDDKTLLPTLKIDGTLEVPLTKRIESYQRAKNMKVIDGWVSPNGPTIKSLIKDAGVAATLDRMTFIRKEIKPALGAKAIQASTFTALYQKQYNILNSKNKNGLKYILDTAKKDADITSISELAYMLATTKHETAHTFRGISEYGRGKGKLYGKEITVTHTDTLKKVSTYNNKYYGRGYVQVTWGFNYQRVDEKLGNGIYPNKNKTKPTDYNKGFTITNPDKSIYLHPDKALEKENAYVAMVYGMQKGIFTGLRIDRYINDLKIDYYNARKVINSTDKAKQISDYAESFEIFLLASTL